MYGDRWGRRLSQRSEGSCWRELWRAGAVAARTTVRPRAPTLWSGGPRQGWSGRRHRWRIIEARPPVRVRSRRPPSCSLRPISRTAASPASRAAWRRRLVRDRLAAANPRRPGRPGGAPQRAEGRDQAQARRHHPRWLRRRGTAGSAAARGSAQHPGRGLACRGRPGPDRQDKHVRQRDDRSGRGGPDRGALCDRRLRGTAGAVISPTRSSPSPGGRRGDEGGAPVLPGLRVLQVMDTPIASAGVTMPDARHVARLQRHGARLRYMLAINGAYFAGARDGAGRRGTSPRRPAVRDRGRRRRRLRVRADPLGRLPAGVGRRAAVSAGLAAHRRAQPGSRGRAASGYVAPPRLITRDHVPDGSVFDPGRLPPNYSRNWGR